MSPTQLRDMNDNILLLMTTTVEHMTEVSIITDYIIRVRFITTRVITRDATIPMVISAILLISVSVRNC